MGYDKFSNPPGGYNSGKAKTGGYNTLTPPDKTYVNPVIPKQKSVNNGLKFTALLPIRDGKGKYHINHFIGYFRFPSELFNRSESIKRFYKKFGEIFSKTNLAIAKAEPDYKFEGQDTIRFTIGGNEGSLLDEMVGVIHDDWVSMQMDSKGESFYATTLKREWMEDNEVMALALLPTPATQVIIRINQRHFLAGKRSWTLGYDKQLNLHYIETAAFERSSNLVYDTVEKTGILREKIKDIWVNLIQNYALEIKVDLLPAFLNLPKDYFNNGYVAYRKDQADNTNSLLELKWFSEVLKRHPGLIKDL